MPKSPKPSGDRTKEKEKTSTGGGTDSSNDTDCIDITLEAVERAFGCTKNQRCAKCCERNECGKEEANRFRKFRKRRSNQLNGKYRCDKDKKIGLCKLKKCDYYNTCKSNVKTDFEKWETAFRNNCKEDLRELTLRKDIK